MAALDFPSSPTPGQTYTANGKTYTYDSATGSWLATNVVTVPISTGVSGLGTGIATALSVNVGSAGAPVVNGGALGTPSSGTLTNATGLPISTGVSGLGTGVATALGNATNAASGIVTLDTSGNATVAGTLAMGSSFLRNRLINPSHAIDQRNAGGAQTITAAAALAYTVDRWYAYCTGANVTGQRITGAVANTYYYRFTGAASVTAIGFAQRIEALNSADLAGKTATFSVDLANSLLTTVTWTAYYANTADTFGTLASPTRTQIATGTFTVNSTVTRYSTNISVPSAATTGIEIVLTVGAQTSGTWTIGNAQFEEGSVASAVERRSYGQELAFAQRYYVKQVAASAYQFQIQAYMIAAANFINLTPLPVTMRAAPTAALIGTWIATNCTVSIANVTPYSFLLVANAVATGTLIAANPANGGYDFNAEL